MCSADFECATWSLVLKHDLDSELSRIYPLSHCEPLLVLQAHTRLSAPSFLRAGRHLLNSSSKIWFSSGRRSMH